MVHCLQPYQTGHQSAGRVLPSIRLDFAIQGNCNYAKRISQTRESLSIPGGLAGDRHCPWRANIGLGRWVANLATSVPGLGINGLLVGWLGINHRLLDHGWLGLGVGLVGRNITMVHAPIFSVLAAPQRAQKQHDTQNSGEPTRHARPPCLPEFSRAGLGNQAGTRGRFTLKFFANQAERGVLEREAV